MHVLKISVKTQAGQKTLQTILRNHSVEAIKLIKKLPRETLVLLYVYYEIHKVFL